MESFFKKILVQISAALVLVSVIFPFFTEPTNAASLTALSDTMTRQQVSVASDHVIKFTTPSGVAAAGTITIDFNTAGFTTGSTAFGDVDFTHGPTTGAETNVTLAATCTTTTWGAAFAANVLTLTSCTGTVTAGDKVIITIGKQAAGGVNQITNPGSIGSKKIAITAGAADSGSLAVPILSPDQVTVTAAVDPSITSSLSPTTCPMNATLQNGTTNFCLVTNTVSTNATSGYTASVADLDPTNPGKLCSPSPATCTNNIPASNTTITYGTSGFGVRTSVAGQTVTNAGACGNDTAQAITSLTGTYKQYSSSVGPISGDTPGLCYKATISGSQAAGSYSEVSTHITTGNF